MGLNVFPPSVAQKEIAYYKSKIGRYGVPLDSRTKLGDTDHSFFSATLADHQSDFEALISPFYDYLDGTTAHLPLVDTYQTDDIHSSSFHARSVVGGTFIKMLADPAIWRKWASADPMCVSSGWAPLPPAPRLTDIVPTSQRQPQTWRYTMDRPSDDWTKQGFDDSHWNSGPGGFGDAGTRDLPVGTVWNTPDIWLRRTFTVPAGAHRDAQVFAIYDEDLTVFVDGVPAATQPGYIDNYELIEMQPAARARLKPGAKVTLAVHCHQTYGGQKVDVGLVDVTPAP